MEKECYRLCVLVVCAVLVAGPCNGIDRDPISRISAESNTGRDRRSAMESTENRYRNQIISPEEIEVKPVVKNNSRTQSNITDDGKKLSVETFINTTPRVVDIMRTGGKKLEIETVVNNTDAVNFEAMAGVNSTADKNNLTAENIDNGTTEDNKLEYTSAYGGMINEKEISIANNWTDRNIPALGNTNKINTDGKLVESTTEMDIKIISAGSNNVTDDKQMTGNVDIATTEEKTLGMRTNNSQTTSNKHKLGKRTGNNIDNDEEVTESGGMNIKNEVYLENISSTMACDRLFSVVIREGKILDNGSLLSMDESSPITYPPGSFWKELNVDNVTEVRGCICEIRNCVRKCCPEGETTLGGGLCIASNLSLLHPFSPTFIDEITNNPVKNANVYIVYGDPCINESYRLDDPVSNAVNQFELLQSGILRVPAEDNYTMAQYCMEAFEDANAIFPLVCFPLDLPSEVKEDEEIYLLYPVGMIISVPFLFATFFVYAVIPELRNLHGKSLMCHVSSLLTAYVFLAIVQLGGDALSNEFCLVCAFAIFFSFHASFFWLNVMCFDIWWTFSGLRPLRGSVKEREHKKFVMYSVYAWGASLVMLVVCMLMDLVPGIPSTYIKPEFGAKKCWFSTNTAVLAYFFGPIGVLVLCNIILFVTTAFKIIGLKRETRMLKGEESKRHDDEANRQQFNLYLKLFIVMGVNWIMEVISWAAGGPNYLWYITDLGNTLQGLLIFIIFVWKDKVRRLLARRFCPKLAGSSPYDNSTKSRATPTHTSSYNYTQRTSISNNDQVHMKPIGTYCNSDVP